jgi:hypothetical protein
MYLEVLVFCTTYMGFVKIRGIVEVSTFFKQLLSHYNIQKSKLCQHKDKHPFGLCGILIVVSVCFPGFQINFSSILYCTYYTFAIRVEASGLSYTKFVL